MATRNRAIQTSTLRRIELVLGSILQILAFLRLISVVRALVSGEFARLRSIDRLLAGADLIISASAVISGMFTWLWQPFPVSRVGVIPTVVQQRMSRLNRLARSGVGVIGAIRFARTLTSAENSPLETPPREIAPDVYWLPIHGSNVYLVQSGEKWVLIDTSWGGCAGAIRRAADSALGPDAHPAAILLTHDHPDHVGAALELANSWDCPIYVHQEELALATATDIATLEQYANPMDRWIILPLVRAAIPRRRFTSMLARNSLEHVVQVFEADGTVPALPDWRWIHAPGHSPGHVVFFRERDGVLISGDALLTIDLNSLLGLLGSRAGAARLKTSVAPWYTNWDQAATESTARRLLELNPRLIASGHGPPVRVDQTDSLEDLS